MLRKKKIKVSKDSGSITITIEVRGAQYLTRGETSQVLSRLTDEAMKSINDVPYMGAYLHEIKVSP